MQTIKDQLYTSDAPELKAHIPDAPELEGVDPVTCESDERKSEPYKPDAKETRVQIVKFALFSLSAGIIETLSFTVLKLITKWTYWPCYLIALILSVLWNFTLNREFTFKSANNVPKAMFQVFIFYCVFTPLSTWWGNALTNGAGWSDYVVLFFTMGINLTTEFLYDRFVVYRDSMNTNKRARKRGESV